jgi:hypothetical protein
MNRPGPLLVFSICAIVDFAFGYFRWHAVGAGFLAIVGGLPLTTLFVLAFWASQRKND